MADMTIGNGSTPPPPYSECGFQKLEINPYIAQTKMLRKKIKRLNEKIIKLKKRATIFRLRARGAEDYMAGIRAKNKERDVEFAAMRARIAELTGIGNTEEEPTPEASGTPANDANEFVLI